MTLKRALERCLIDNNTTAARNVSTSKKADSFSNKPKHLQTGEMGEDMAAEFLSSLGYRIIDRNIRYKCGEIDIIASERDEIVFVEVRTRSVGWIMPAEFTVGPSKIKKLIKSARIWTEGKNYCGFWRIDLIAITINVGCESIIEHFVNITEGIQ